MASKLQIGIKNAVKNLVPAQITAIRPNIILGCVHKQRACEHCAINADWTKCLTRLALHLKVRIFQLHVSREGAATFKIDYSAYKSFPDVRFHAVLARIGEIAVHVSVIADHARTDILRDWPGQNTRDLRFLMIEFIKPAERTLKIFGRTAADDIHRTGDGILAE